MELTPTSLILKVSVGKGTNFATGLFSGVSPYVVVTGGKYRVQTRVVKGEANPEWNQDYLFVLENPTQAQLKIDVMTRSHLGDKCLGSATIGLQGLVMGSPQDFSFPMLRGGKKEKAAISINLMSLNMTVPGTIQSFVPVAEPTIAGGGGGATEVQQYVPVAPVMEHHQSSLPPPLPPQSYAPQYEQPHPHAQQPQQPQQPQPQPQQQFLQQQPSYVSYAPHSETTQGMYAGHGVATAGGPGYQPLYGGPAAGPSVAPMAPMAPMAPVVPATNPYAK